MREWMRKDIIEMVLYADEERLSAIWHFLVNFLRKRGTIT